MRYRLFSFISFVCLTKHTLLLEFSDLFHPETVQIAEFIGSNRLLIGSKCKFRSRFPAGCQMADGEALAGLEADPLDRMLGQHRMRHGADAHFDDGAIDLYDGNVFFLCRIGGVRLQFRHVLPAAGKLSAAGLDHCDQIAAEFTFEETHIAHIRIPFSGDSSGKTIDVYESILVHDPAGCIGPDDMFFPGNFL
jgi:hypothetical protein